VTDGALLALIENYCRESGVRNLQKHIEKIYRKVCSIFFVNTVNLVTDTGRYAMICMVEKTATLDLFVLNLLTALVHHYI